MPERRNSPILPRPTGSFNVSSTASGGRSFSPRDCPHFERARACFRQSFIPEPLFGRIRDLPRPAGRTVMGTALQHHPRGAHFGDFLRGARERRGLTIRDISNETKIPWRHLDAFEHGDLTVVPNRMYRRAEVRAY